MKKKPKRRDTLSLLLEFGRRTAAERRLLPLLKLLTDETKELLSADRCTIFIHDPATKKLWSKVAHGLERNYVRIPDNAGLAGECFQKSRIINIADAYKDSRFNSEVDKKTGYRTRTILSAPMVNHQEKTIGVFQVLNKKKGKFAKQDEEILTIITSQAAAAVENVQLYEELRETQREAILRLAIAAEFRDEDTANHIRRMAEYSVVIARQMKFPVDWIETLQLAAPMHDAGKLGVPDAILLKPGKLTDEEFDQMKLHTLKGANILKGSKSPLIQMAERIALTHHEKWDGTGYPHGLSGEKIPIEGRIASLADVYDALSSKRPYKEPWPEEKIVGLIKENRGSQFDPAVVDAFFKTYDEIKKVKAAITDSLTG